jgi:hypothetical protein
MKPSRRWGRAHGQAYPVNTVYSANGEISDDASNAENRRPTQTVSVTTTWNGNATTCGSAEDTNRKSMADAGDARIHLTNKD